MNDLRDLLKGGDPVAREGELSPDEAARIRTRLRSALASRPRVGHWFFAVMTVAMVLLAAGGTWIAQRSQPMAPGADVRAPGPGVQADEPARTRQVQFVTAGGTRVFWTLHVKAEER
jgi:hypothetical protein